MANNSRRALPWLTRSAYAVGHVLNDLSAAAWFSYLIVYFQKVRQMSASHAGILLFVGQGVDAAMTPTVGVLSDKFTELPYGQRKSWHLFGTLCVALSFPFVLGSDFAFVKHMSVDGMLGYFSVFIALFQIGWASTQVAHLSLIPELTSSCHERDFLNSARYAMTILASVTVFGLAFGLLQASSGRDLGPSDMFHFALLAYIVVGLGGLTSLYFHLGVKEPSHADKRAACGKHEAAATVVWSDWFKRLLFYQVGGVYMTARLVVNVSQVYLPLYLLDTLEMNKTNIAIAPLTVFISGLLTTSLQKLINNAVGRRMTLLVGIVLTLGTCAGAMFVEASNPYIVYLVVVGLGAGGTTMLVTALAMEADLIGDDVEGSAFVYGSLSFLDKLSNGIAVLVIQFLAQTYKAPDASGPTAAHPSGDAAAPTAPGLASFYRNVLVFVPGVSAIACALFMFTTYLAGGYHEYSKKKSSASSGGGSGSAAAGSTSVGSGRADDTRPLLGTSPSGVSAGSINAPAMSPEMCGSYGAVNPLDLNAGYHSMPADLTHHRRANGSGPIAVAGSVTASPDPSRIYLSHNDDPNIGSLLKTWDDGDRPGIN